MCDTHTHTQLQVIMSPKVIVIENKMTLVPLSAGISFLFFLKTFVILSGCTSRSKITPSRNLSLLNSVEKQGQSTSCLKDFETHLKQSLWLRKFHLVASFLHVLKNSIPPRRGTGLPQLRIEAEVLRGMDKWFPRLAAYNQVVSKTIDWRMKGQMVILPDLTRSPNQVNH